MRAPLNMQGWALEVCVRRARAIAKMERMSEKEAEHFRGILLAVVESNAMMTPHADDIRALIKSKRGRE